MVEARWGAGGGGSTKVGEGGEVPRENWIKKIHGRQWTLKNIHAKAQKKKKYKENNNENKIMRIENSPPPPQ